MDRAAAVGVTRGGHGGRRPGLGALGRSTPRAGTTGCSPPSRCTRPARPTSTDDDRAEIERLAAHPRVVAVGETGLDYYWDYSPAATPSSAAFRWHIDLAKRARQAADDPRPRRARRHPADPARGGRRRPTVVFHCFSGDAAMARECVDAGYVLSFAGPVTFRNAPRPARGRRAGARRPAPRRDRRPVPHPAPAPRPGQRAVLPAVDGAGARRASAACPTSGSRHALGVTPSGCFGSTSCRPARRLVHRAQWTHVRRSERAVQRSRCVTASVPAARTPLRFRDR